MEYHEHIWREEGTLLSLLFAFHQFLLYEGNNLTDYMCSYNLMTIGTRTLNWNSFTIGMVSLVLRGVPMPQVHVSVIYTKLNSKRVRSYKQQKLVIIQRCNIKVQFKPKWFPSILLLPVA